MHLVKIHGTSGKQVRLYEATNRRESDFLLGSGSPARCRLGGLSQRGKPGSRGAWGLL